MRNLSCIFIKLSFLRKCRPRTASFFQKNNVDLEEKSCCFEGKSPAYSFKREILMQAESYFLSANFAILTTLIVFLLSFLSDNLSFMLISKTSTMNKIMNVALALLALTAGVMEIAQEERWKVDESTGKRTMSDLDESTRVAAGYITVLNGVLFLVGYALARRDFSLKPENVDAERFTVETTAPGRQNLWNCRVDGKESPDWDCMTCFPSKLTLLCCFLFLVLPEQFFSFWGLLVYWMVFMSAVVITFYVWRCALFDGWLVWTKTVIQTDGVKRWIGVLLVLWSKIWTLNRTGSDRQILIASTCLLYR